MDRVEAQHFASAWAEDWNSHDLDRIMNHFADNVVFQSPVAAELLANCDGTVRGKEALRAYFAAGLRHFPDLHFDVLEVYGGINAIVINHRSQGEQLANEILLFEGSLVVWGPAPTVPASLDEPVAVHRLSDAPPSVRT